MTVQGAHIPLGKILKSGNRNKILHSEKNKTLEKFVQRGGQISLAWRNLGLASTGPWISSSQVIPISCFQVGRNISRGFLWPRLLPHFDTYKYYFPLIFFIKCKLLK